MRLNGGNAENRNVTISFSVPVCVVHSCRETNETLERKLYFLTVMHLKN